MVVTGGAMEVVVVAVAGRQGRKNWTGQVSSDGRSTNPDRMPRLS